MEEANLMIFPEGIDNVINGDDQSKHFISNLIKESNTHEWK